MVSWGRGATQAHKLGRPINTLSQTHTHTHTYTYGHTEQVIRTNRDDHGMICVRVLAGFPTVTEPKAGTGGLPTLMGNIVSGFAFQALMFRLFDKKKSRLSFIYTHTLPFFTSLSLSLSLSASLVISLPLCLW